MNKSFSEEEIKQVNAYVDSKSFSMQLTHEEYVAYISNFCWYCGRPYASEPELVDHILTKTETKYVFPNKYITKEYTKHIKVPQCHECSTRKDYEDGPFLLYLVLSFVTIIYPAVQFGLWRYEDSHAWYTGIFCGLLALLFLGTIAGFIYYLIISRLIRKFGKYRKLDKLRSIKSIPQAREAIMEGYNV